MAKLIDQIDSSGLFAQSAYSAAIATNDDLGRKISETYLTGVDLSPYATTDQVDSVSSLLSAGLDYVSANAGGLDPSAVILTGYNSTAKKFYVGNGLLEHSTEVSPGYIGVSGKNSNAYPVDVVVVHHDENGFTMNKVVHKLSEKLNASASAGFVSTATFNTVSSTLSGAIDYVSAHGGKTYNGVNPIQVNNTTNEISITGQSLSAGPNIDIFASGGYVVISAQGGGSEGKTYTGIAPIQVDNVNDEISVDCGLVSAGPGIDIVSDANGIMFSATNFYYSNTSPTTATSAYSGLYIEKEFQLGKTTRTFYAAGEGVGELVPTGYNTGNYLTTTVAGMTWSPLPDYGAPVVLVATSGDIPASGSSDNKVYIVTGTV